MSADWSCVPAPCSFWRMVSAELLLLMLSLAMRKSSGVQLFSILDSASVTSSLLPPAHAHASWH